MDDALHVRVRECVRHLLRDRDRVVHRQLLLAIQSIAQRQAVHERHDVVQHAVGGAGIENANDAWMLQRCANLDLAQKPLHAERDRELGEQHFHRDVTVMR
jgi:hypothetical protein